MEFHEAANIFPLDEEHIPELAADIKAHGLLCPIETYKGKIIDGRRRLEACKRAKVSPDFAAVDSLVEDPVEYVMSVNFHRRHLSISQAAMCAQRARDYYDEAAKERQKAGLKRGTEKPVVDNCSQREGKARDQVGERFGVSGGSVDRARRVIEDGIPELVKAVDSDKVTVYRASQIARQPKELQPELLTRELEPREQSRKSPKAKPQDRKEEATPGEVQGVGVIRANEAIDCLKRIPKKDRLRKRGFQIVSDWIKANR